MNGAEQTFARYPALLRQFFSRLWPAPPRQDHLRWLYAPGIMSFGYALRTAITSMIALGIALWWELSSPQWAALTVWMVAQGSRGRSIAKARWHLFGMVLGSICAVGLVAACPQQPLLFILLLAAGIGGFCFIGTLLPGPPTMTNYRIHGMRASGFTYAIISLDGIADPNHIFEIASARVTYILLGIVLETSISSLFQFQLAQRARARLTANFLTAMTQASQALVSLLRGDTEIFSRSRNVFSTISTLSDQVEFAEVELGKHRGHEGDHARAALGQIAHLLARGLELGALMRATNEASSTAFATISQKCCNFLITLPAALAAESDNDVLGQLAALRIECDSGVADSLSLEMTQDITHLPTPDEERTNANQRMLLGSLGELLDTLEQAIVQFQASRHPLPHDHFHYRAKTFRDWRQATSNSLRASLSIFAAGLIWVVTAWTQGIFFLMFVSIICSLFSTLEKPALASKGFLVGTLWATMMGSVLVLTVTSAPSSFELLAYFLGGAMLLGGMAFAYAPLALAAVAYNLFITILIAPSNDGRIDELLFLNTAMPLVFAMAFAMIMFGVVLPFDTNSIRWELRSEILRGLRKVARTRTPPGTKEIVEHGEDCFVRLLGTTQSTQDLVIDSYLRGILSSLAIGLNIARLRTIIARAALPAPTQAMVVAMMKRMAQFTGRYGGHYGRTVRAAKLAIERIVHDAASEPNLSTHLEMNRALASLTVIASELERNCEFFDAEKTYLDSTSDQLA